MITDIRLAAIKDYIERTKRVLELSSPQVDEIDNAEYYRVYLQDSFREIRHLAYENNQTLGEYLLPCLRKGIDLSEEDVAFMRAVGPLLIDTNSMENLDLALIYELAERILEHAEKSDDLRTRVLAYDNMVIAAYMMVNLTTRLYPELDDFTRYRNTGLDAANKLLDLLEPDKFAALPDEECKTLVLINARYMRCLLEWDEIEDKSEVNRRDLRLMRRAMDLADDPFYREQVPNYNWDGHLFRALQYVSDLTEKHNRRGFNDEQLLELRGYIERLVALVDEHPEFEESCPRPEQNFYLLQSAYLTKQLNMEEYRKGLLSIIDQSDPTDFSVRSMFTNFVVSFEYLETYSGEKLNEPEKKAITAIYKFTAGYAYHMPKTGVLSFMLTFVAGMLRDFIEIPGGIRFQDMCLKLLAAMHPPTYVHTLNVASLTRFLTDHLIDRNPELFIGEAGTKSGEEVVARREEILTFAYNAALLHDVGKLFIIEVIMTYGRDLIDTERELLQIHTEIGASLLRRFPKTEAFADIALGHHRWYDNSDGYPEKFDMDKVAHRTLVSVVQVADCLDAATDTVGRTYKEGKSAEENIEELREGRGTRYAPYVVDLFDDLEIVAELRTLLNEGRDENYRETYRELKAL